MLVTGLDRYLVAAIEARRSGNRWTLSLLR